MVAYVRVQTEESIGLEIITIIAGVWHAITEPQALATVKTVSGVTTEWSVLHLGKAITFSAS